MVIVPSSLYIHPVPSLPIRLSGHKAQSCKKISWRLRQARLYIFFAPGSPAFHNLNKNLKILYNRKLLITDKKRETPKTEIGHKTVIGE
jgi:hypothetical protein